MLVHEGMRALYGNLVTNMLGARCSIYIPKHAKCKEALFRLSVSETSFAVGQHCPIGPPAAPCEEARRVLRAPGPLCQTREALLTEALFAVWLFAISAGLAWRARNALIWGHAHQKVSRFK